MHVRIALALLVIASSLPLAAQLPSRAGALNFAPAATIAEVDTDRLKGQPARLAWSPDGAQLYLQMLDGNFGQAGGRLAHFIFDADSGKRRDLNAEPEWASAYWTTKSAQASPDNAALKIDLRSAPRTEKSISVPMGGDLARGGADTGASGSSAGDGIAAAYGRQSVMVHSMYLGDELVGEFVNSVIVPGLTFGWGPRGSQMFAYSAAKSGRIVIVDSQGETREIAGSKDALLPAWSPDARRLAWLQRDSRKKFVLQVARAAAP